MVAQCQRCRQRRATQQGVDLAFTEYLGQTLADFRGVDVRQGIDEQDLLLLQKLKKSA